MRSEVIKLNYYQSLGCNKKKIAGGGLGGVGWLEMTRLGEKETDAGRQKVKSGEGFS